MKKYISILPILTLLLISCATNKRIVELEDRISVIEKINKNQQIALNHLTDKIFDGQSETIHGKTFFPKAKVHETDQFTIYYRKKANDNYLDAVVLLKKDLILLPKGTIIAGKTFSFSDRGFKIGKGNLKIEEKSNR